jgi:hypothetical protein
MEVQSGVEAPRAWEEGTPPGRSDNVPVNSALTWLLHIAHGGIRKMFLPSTSIWI